MFVIIIIYLIDFYYYLFFYYLLLYVIIYLIYFYYFYIFIINRILEIMDSLIKKERNKIEYHQYLKNSQNPTEIEKNKKYLLHDL